MPSEANLLSPSNAATERCRCRPRTNGGPTNAVQGAHPTKDANHKLALAGLLVDRRPSSPLIEDFASARCPAEHLSCAHKKSLLARPEPLRRPADALEARSWKRGDWEISI